jgi:ribonuclease HI
LNPADVLRRLAETLSVSQTLDHFPDLDRAALRDILLRAADRMPDRTESSDPSAEPGRGLTLFTDGASRGNPGPAGAGALIVDESGREIARDKKFLGKMTNNQAEYQALLLGLDLALDLAPAHLAIRLDSELAVKQLRGEYRVKDPKLAVLFNQVRDKLNALAGYDILHVRREKNAEADRLANQAIDDEYKGG